MHLLFSCRRRKGADAEYHIVLVRVSRHDDFPIAGAIRSRIFECDAIAFEPSDKVNDPLIGRVEFEIYSRGVSLLRPNCLRVIAARARFLAASKPRSDTYGDYEKKAVFHVAG